ncbi:LuxR C-terminal-related transcriptional regulator [Streptomyces sp. NPDC053431]|uniref:helix-turn-helix transcriptional regulator n=1 Tax=Streptomyces sp. NPDC053431 TaxID=3365703 RepID=UPI0037CFB529
MSEQVATGSRWPFAAREYEVSLCADALATSEITMFIVHGKGGVGKTRLGEECLEFAKSVGHATLTAAATPASAQLPLSTISHLLPPDVKPDDPIAAFTAASRLCRRASQESLSRSGDQRVVVFVDDLQWLDNSSALVLRQLLAAEMIFLIGTVHAELPASEAVAALDTKHDARHVRLREFSVADTREVLAQVLGAPVEHTTLHELFDISRGNVLFLRELVEGALTAGTLIKGHRLWRLTGKPSGTVRLHDVIQRRLKKFYGTARTALETLALCEPVALETLEQLTSHEELERLEQQKIITVITDGRRSTCTLAHPLYGESLRAGISSLRRRQIYLTQAERIQKLKARRLDDVLHIATWKLAAGESVSVTGVIRAARRAKAASDYSMMLNLLSSIPDDEASCHEVALLKGEALSRVGQCGKAEIFLARAQELASSDDAYLTAILERVLNLWWGLGEGDRAIEVLQQAQYVATYAKLHRPLEIIEAGLLHWSDHIPSALRFLDDVKLVSTPLARMWAQAQRCHTLIHIGRTGEALSLSNELQRTAYGKSPSCSVEIARLAALIESGRLEEARSTGTQMFKSAVDGKYTEMQVWISFQLGHRDLLAGHLQSAYQWFIEASALAKENSYPMALDLAETGIVAAAAQLGRTDEARSVLARVSHRNPDLTDGGPKTKSSIHIVQHYYDLSTAWLAAVEGDMFRARRRIIQSASAAAHAGSKAIEGWLLSEAGRLGGATEVHERLGKIAATADSALLKARANFASALVSGDPERGAAAAEECGDLGLHLLAAEVASFASSAFSRDREWRRAAAATTLTENMLKRCGGGIVTPGLFEPVAFPLTERERQISVMAARGMASQEIAKRLVLSVRTVDNHLHRAYGKLGISSRQELAGIFQPPVKGSRLSGEAQM